MALYLAVLGGVAVAEVHRAVTGGNKDVDMLKKREDILRKQLQDIQKELLANKEQRQLSEAEAVQLSAINSQLQADRDELSRRSENLQAQNEELIARADRLLERQQLLEQCAESLKLENSILIQQFDRLKLKYEQESSGFQEKLSELKTNVSSVLHKFTQGDITADQLIKFLGDMGVELKCPTEQVQKLPERLAIAATEEDRTKALDNVEIQVQDSWISQMKLVTLDPQRAARLLASGASAATPRDVPSITDIQTNTTANSNSTQAPQLEQRRIATPPRAREAAAAQAAALKISSHALPSDDEPKDTIGAIHASTTTTAPAALLTEKASDDSSAKENRKAEKGRSLLFRPAKKTAKKMLTLKGPQPLLEMEVETGHNSAVPRLAFDAIQADDVSGGPRGGSGGALMAL